MNTFQLFTTVIKFGADPEFGLKRGTALDLKGVFFGTGQSGPFGLLVQNTKCVNLQTASGKHKRSHGRCVNGSALLADDGHSGAWIQTPK